MDMPLTVRDALEQLNERSREQAIERLVANVRLIQANTSEVDLAHMHNEPFKELFLAKYEPEMEELNSIISGVAYIRQSAATGARHLADFVQQNAQNLLHLSTLLSLSYMLLHPPCLLAFG